MFRSTLWRLFPVIMSVEGDSEQRGELLLLLLVTAATDEDRDGIRNLDRDDERNQRLCVLPGLDIAVPIACAAVEADFVAGLYMVIIHQAALRELPGRADCASETDCVIVVTTGSNLYSLHGVTPCGSCRFGVNCRISMF